MQHFADDHVVQRDAMAQVDAVTRTSGSPMRAHVQREMESEFGGEDFSDVRVHVDRDSAEAAGAKAYTTKTNHIVFRSMADMDDHTMRHELQHVRQQRAGRVPSGVSDPSDALERDAESTATELGRESTNIRRSIEGEPNHTPISASVQRDAVQRRVSKVPHTKKRSRRRQQGVRQRPAASRARTGHPASTRAGRRGDSSCVVEAHGNSAVVRGKSSPGPAVSTDEQAAPRTTVLNINGDFRVQGNAAMFLGNFFTGSTNPASPTEETAAPTTRNFAGNFTTEGGPMFLGNTFNSRDMSFRSRENTDDGTERADSTGEAAADYTHENLFLGNTFHMRGGTLTLTGGVYYGNTFVADRIIIRGDAVFVGNNSFEGKVEVEDPDQVAGEIYLGEITDAHADQIGPLDNGQSSSTT